MTINKIDVNSDTYTDVAKDGVEGPFPDIIRVVVAKINEIIDWINTQ
tara:strand:- start:515 stop:655 length:141 start_codon:yes stop_codon:yes gene_type:complete